jgi:Mg-chelatase subunit ChlD
MLICACDEYKTVLPEPAVRNISGEQSEIIRLFSQLTGGDESACNLIFEPSEIPNTLCRILINARPGSEIVFLVDKTGSMEDDIDQVKSNINRILECLPQGVRVGAATYGDNRIDGDEWYTSVDLSEDVNITRNFINTISVVGGGDIPESVYDGLFRVLDEMSWRDCEAPDQIIVMGDAPPHTGSLTDNEVEDVLAKARSICPTTLFYPVIVIDI